MQDSLEKDQKKKRLHKLKEMYHPVSKRLRPNSSLYLWKVSPALKPKGVIWKIAQYVCGAAGLGSVRERGEAPVGTTAALLARWILTR